MVPKLLDEKLVGMLLGDCQVSTLEKKPDLEDIMLSEISQTQKDKYYMISLM